MKHAARGEKNKNSYLIKAKLDGWCFPIASSSSKLCYCYFFELCSAVSSSFKAPQLLRALLRSFFELCSAVSSSFKAPQLLRALRLCNFFELCSANRWPSIGALALDWDLSPDSHHLSRWYTESSRELFDHGKSTFIFDDALLLRSSLHKKNNDSEHFLLLGDQIANGDAKWGNTTPLFGEISFIDGY
ncbi:hypothetical protein RHGRI_021616 [Rhododendron griersonianum]|uniref:Uncharacterized protein n=1 Tax=Rhododendron griersonianum TaxID=479676 RepID=A0AAV6JPV6_9ERIC|nr:hypothetical protein RHGRI_021616 [Rhododendron griersonianum]